MSADGKARARSADLDHPALPADLHQWLPKDDLVYFILDVVG